MDAFMGRFESRPKIRLSLGLPPPSPCFSGIFSTSCPRILQHASGGATGKPSQNECERRVQRQHRHGLVVLVGIEDADTEADAGWLAAKLVRLRIFNDDREK